MYTNFFFINNSAFTKEAALVRSIINASMMYLVVKTCINSNYLSCGCWEKDRISFKNTFKHLIIKRKSSNDLEVNDFDNVNNNSIFLKQEDLSANDLSKLDAGSPVHLSKSSLQRQGKININDF